MTNEQREQAAQILHPETTAQSMAGYLLNGKSGDSWSRAVNDACLMGAEALRNGTKAIEILKNVDWVGSGAKGMIQDAIELLKGAGNDKG